MATWPVYIDEGMIDDLGLSFGLGQRVSWVVGLVDGEAKGWPWQVLVDTSVTIVERSDERAPIASVAQSDDVVGFWWGPEELGTTIRIRAGLSADFWNPPFKTTVTGRIRRLRVVSFTLALDDEGVASVPGPWALEEYSGGMPSWPPPRISDERSGLPAGWYPVDPTPMLPRGLLVDLDVISSHLGPRES